MPILPATFGNRAVRQPAGPLEKAATSDDAARLIRVFDEIEALPKNAFVSAEGDARLRVLDIQFGLLLKRLGLADAFKPPVKAQGDWEVLPNCRLVALKNPNMLHGGVSSSTCVDDSIEWHAHMQALRKVVLEMQTAEPASKHLTSFGTPVESEQAAETAESGDEAHEHTFALVRLFTNGVADDRIEKATRLLSISHLTVNEKLNKIDAVIPFPATASAEQLGDMLGVTKQAVLKTEWWIENRKGEKDNEIGRRRAGYQKRAKGYEPPGTNTDNE